MNGGMMQWRTVAIAAAALALAGGLVWMTTRSSVDGVTLSVRPPATPVQVGSEFTVDVLSDAAGYSLTAADLIITFDPRILRAVSISPGDLMPSELAKGSVAQGRATITVASGTTPAAGVGVIARVTFQALASGRSDVALAQGTQAAAAGHPGDVVARLIPTRVEVR